MELWKLSENEQLKEIRKKMIPVYNTETNLRRWQRRLIVAITPEEKAKCEAKIKLYSGG